ncbi:MAG TPA: hypothetical protein P5290_02950 [Candidatus Methanomethylicus sp.]|nr:hypothetical protein [Candidatus Methanomethylicus sp.]
MKTRIQAENESMSLADYLRMIFDETLMIKRFFVNRWSGVQTPLGLHFLHPTDGMPTVDGRLND